MAHVDPKLGDFGALKKVYNFSDGLYTVRAIEDIPENASPRVANCCYDNTYRLSKQWGTSELITVSSSDYNRFITNPVYSMYPYVSPGGSNRLVIQGVDASDAKMSLYYLDQQASYPATLSGAPTRILGANDELTDKRRCTYATYKGRMYIWNGTDDLRYWTGNDTEWHSYHSNKDERFKYITTFGRRLWAANSAVNPSRVIYTNLNYCNFVHYFNQSTNYIDFNSPTDYSPIMWITQFKGSLLIFKINSIYRFYGDPDTTGIAFDLVSHGIGTINGWSVQVWKDRVYFAWKDGIYAYGDTNVIASSEDRSVNAEPNIIRITSEIDDYWRDRVTIPNPYKVKDKVWSGATDFDAMTALTHCESRTATVTDNVDVINASWDTGTNPVEVESYKTTAATWVALKSTLGRSQYWSQTAKLGATQEQSIPYAVGFWLKAAGTVTSSHIMDVYICDGKSTDTKPDFDNVYGESMLTGANLAGISALAFDGGGEEPVVGNTLELTAGGTATGVLNRTVLLGGKWDFGTAYGYFYITDKTGTWANDGTIGINGGSPDIAYVNEPVVGDSSPISTGCWVYFPIQYRDNPQNLYNGDALYPPTFFIAIKTTAMDDTNYISWNYTTVAGGGSYASGRMYNSDETTPASQDLCDYTFSLYCMGFWTTATIETDTLDVSEEGKEEWRSVNVSYNSDSIAGYTRQMVLDEIRYQIKPSDSGWTLDAGGGTVVENGGGIIGDGDFLRLLISFKRPTGTTWIFNDSFSLQSIQVSYSTEVMEKKLIDSAVYRGNYVLSVYEIGDPEGG